MRINYLATLLSQHTHSPWALENTYINLRRVLCSSCTSLSLRHGSSAFQDLIANIRHDPLPMMSQSLSAPNTAHGSTKSATLSSLILDANNVHRSKVSRWSKSVVVGTCPATFFHLSSRVPFLVNSHIVLIPSHGFPFLGV